MSGHQEHVSDGAGPSIDQAANRERDEQRPGQFKTRSREAQQVWREQRHYQKNGETKRDCPFRDNLKHRFQFSSFALAVQLCNGWSEDVVQGEQRHRNKYTVSQCSSILPDLNERNAKDSQQYGIDRIQHRINDRCQKVQRGKAKPLAHFILFGFCCSNPRDLAKKKEQVEHYAERRTRK